MRTGIRRGAWFTAAAIILVIAFGGTTFGQAVGTWKLNLAKSTYQQGQAPKSATLVYEAAGEGIKVTVDQMPAERPRRSTTPTRRTMTGRMFRWSATRMPIWRLARE